MAVFTYKAIERDAVGEQPKQQPRRGTCSADTPLQARERLRAQRLRVQELAETGSDASSRGRRFSWQPRAPGALVVAWTQELATMLSAGIRLLEAMDAGGSQYRGRFGAALLMLREQIAAGSSLADAMRHQPKVFDELCVSM